MVKDLIKQVKLTRLPNEVLLLIDIINNGFISKRNGIKCIWYKKDVLFHESEGNHFCPHYQEISQTVFNKRYYSIQDVKDNTKLIEIAIHNSKYSGWKIIW